MVCHEYLSGSCGRERHFGTLFVRLLLEPLGLEPGGVAVTVHRLCYLSARFSSNGENVLTASWGGTARIRAASSEWFLALAEATAQIRLDAHGNVEMVPLQAWTEFGRAGSEKRRRWLLRSRGRWFLDDPDSRPFDPF